MMDFQNNECGGVQQTNITQTDDNIQESIEYLLKQSEVPEELSDNLLFLNEKHKSTIVPLKDRDDVVYKAIVRAIRRFVMTKYRSEYSQSRFRTEYKKLKHYSTSTLEFTKKLKLSANEVHNSYDIESTKNLLAIIINLKFFKKTSKELKDSHRKSLIEFEALFTMCCKSYAHARFDELIKNKYF